MRIRSLALALSVNLLAACATHAPPTATTALAAAPAGDTDKQRQQFIRTAERLHFHLVMIDSDPYYCRNEAVVDSPLTKQVCLTEPQMAARIITPSQD
jgi:hypothetical protein